ncbi:PREDICTED: uncharacterized protein LOC104810392 [Tarenaya hassleriana]|uniref:uncharacterized protein LOC104810392 n=1 Tax=Tarenaya hassleriana TaxID=28532 RepID=UPI00053C9BF6|nr:PREDICTED: uncharacterized protein LOC104810392 [Tarenaya hassleriana]
MAMAYSCQIGVPLQKPCPVPKSVRRTTSMLQQSRLQVKKVAVSRPQSIRFSPKNKVFEDPVEGIVCYRDGNGEIVCEGYDEGPRYLPQSSRVIACYSREAEILDLLQRSYQQLIDSGKNHRQIAAPQQGLMSIKWSSFNLF